MVTRYKNEIEQAIDKEIDETLDYLCKEYKDPTMRAGFEIFAVHMRGAALRISSHVSNRNAGRITGGYKTKKGFNEGQYIGPYKEKKK